VVHDRAAYGLLWRCTLANSFPDSCFVFVVQGERDLAVEFFFACEVAIDVRAVEPCAIGEVPGVRAWAGFFDSADPGRDDGAATLFTAIAAT
jgi:hypothetical protein